MSVTAQRAEARLIQPCYDALENSNWKSGIAQCQRMLIKVKSGPNHHVVLALLAFYLRRSHNLEQAAEISLKLEGLQVESEEALRFMKIVMCDLGRAEYVPALYLYAFEKQPKNLNLGIQLCLAYVWVKDWSNVQKTSFKLHSQFHEPRTVFWSALSMLIQATATPPPPTAAITLALAHRLISTAPNPAQSPSHIFLFVRVLLARSALASTPEDKAVPLRDAWTFLESKKAQEVGRGQLEVGEVRWEVVKALGGLPEVEIVAGTEEATPTETKKGVWESEWSRFDDKIRGIEDVKDFNHLTYLHLIDLALLLAPTHPDIIGQTRDTFNFMVKDVGGRERGPLLASLELEKRLVVEAATEVEKDVAKQALPSLVRSYFETFSTKPCCFEDLKPFFPLDSAAVEELSQTLKLVLETKPTSAKELYSHINAHKILRSLSEVPSDQDGATTATAELELATTLMELHRLGLEFGKDLVKTELQPSDDLVILATNALISAWDATRDSTHLFKAIVFLEHAQRSSDQNHYFRLLLIRIYRLLGAPSLTLPRFKALKVASVQQDTLSHVLLARGNTFAGDGNGLESRDICRKARQYYEATDAELPDMIMGAFNNESYPQIGDFLEFETRLGSSLQRSLLLFENFRMELALPHQEEDVISVQKLKDFQDRPLDQPLRDNRDFHLTPSYQPRGSRGVETLTALGPDIAEPWLRTISSAYLDIVTLPPPSTPEAASTASPSPPSSSLDLSTLTPEESALVRLSADLVSFASSLDSAGADVVVELPPSLLAFFSDVDARLRVVLAGSVLGWDVLHIASTALEGFVLVDLVTKARKALPSVGKKARRTPPAVQALLVGSKSTLRAIASLLRSAGDAAGSSGRKQFTKACAGLGTIGIDSDFVLDVATQVATSKKAALLGLGKKITERIALD